MWIYAHVSLRFQSNVSHCRHVEAILLCMPTLLHISQIVFPPKDACRYLVPVKLSSLKKLLSYNSFKLQQYM